MPVLGMAQDSGVVVSWLKQQGDYVAEGEPLLEVETDKAVVEVPAMASGVLADVTAGAGTEVPTGTVIARLLAAGEASGDASVERPGMPASSLVAAASAQPADASPPPQNAGAPIGLSSMTSTQVAGPPASSHPVEAAAFPAAASRGVPSPGQRVVVGPPRPLASPKAKRLARELGIDLLSVDGTGPNGAVRTKDLVSALVRARETGPAPATSWLRRAVPLTPVRDLVANANALMEHSRRGVTISLADVLGRLTVAAFAASGNPVPHDIWVTRNGAGGRPESCRITDPLRSTIVGFASGWNTPTEVEGVAVHVLDLSGSPFESPPPPTPPTCKVRVTLAGSDGDAGTLTLEHGADPGIEPATLMTRLIELLEDPLAALLYV